MFMRKLSLTPGRGELPTYPGPPCLREPLGTKRPHSPSTLILSYVPSLHPILKKKLSDVQRLSEAVKFVRLRKGPEV